jgi:uncharacterized protein (DUF433 family)
MKEKNMPENLIISDPSVMMGKPVIRGTRITVELILEKIAHGESIESIIEAHPHLSREMVLAAVDYAVKVLRSGVVYSSQTYGRKMTHLSIKKALGYANRL